MSEESSKKLSKEQESGATPSRLQSHLRVKAPLRSGIGTSLGPNLSTLPPPPFDNEVDVAGREWWLESHMQLAANLLCVEQSDVAGLKLQRFAEFFRATVRDVEAVRDALYELYCDAADSRMTLMIVEGVPLGVSIRAAYAWTERVLETLLAITSPVSKNVRAETNDDAWREQLRAVAVETFPVTIDAVRAEIASLPIATDSPVEPLRKIRRNVDDLFASLAWLKLRIAALSRAE